MSDIKNVIAKIDTIIKNNVTITGSQVYPSEEQKTGIFVNLFEESGRFEGRSAGWGQSFHVISAYILGAKSNMINVFKQLEGKMERISEDILADVTIGGTCDAFLNVTYELVTVNLAGVDYTGYRLLINEIKIPRTF